MSETKLISVPIETREKLRTISKKFSELNTGSIGDEFWIASSNGDSGYDWGQMDIGVNRDGQLITCEQGGCSCNGPEAPTADKQWPLTESIVLKEGNYSEVEPTVTELIEVTDTLFDVLQGSTVNAEAVLSLPNAEIRRAVIELIGYDKIIDRAELLDESTDGRLLRIKQENDEDIVLVHVKDPSTERQYFLRVPPATMTAREARAWTFGFEAKDFEPVVER
ncbi:DUF6745 domain-containing protein [Arthrobacter sp. EpRS71]|uniref:DUF6745 domain-containing protein n=1 Tax=Arthrobacter sp. EpRS71 TaxID=1743141 RepID=UPI000746F92A|nr:hypothetical protein [Arthrobacter sp. EpRS71]KUM38986.1 hypothetical protein AR689_07480 [Arthrobacter sp. EpRS71]